MSSATARRSARRRFLDQRLAVGALVGLVVLVAFAFVGPSLWHYGHALHRDIPIDQAPSWSHPFGTDRAGHDLLGQVMRGTRQSLLVGVLAAAISTGIGLTVGLLALSALLVGAVAIGRLTRRQRPAPLAHPQLKET